MLVRASVSAKIMNVLMAVVFIKSSKEIAPSAGDILRQIDLV
jgi:hypothetical protein